MSAPAAAVAASARQLSGEALAVMAKFPPRPEPASWPETAADRFTVMRRMLAPPFLFETAQTRDTRKLAMLKILHWLELQPGSTWQERWDASGAGADGRTDWRDQVITELSAGPGLHNDLGGGLAQLIGGDVLRPGLSWLLANRSPRGLWQEMGRTRDPAGLTALRQRARAGGVNEQGFERAAGRVAIIMAAKGGMVADITPGDCMQLLELCLQDYDDMNLHSPFFYELLHQAGIFPAGAPATIRMIDARFAGQLTPDQLIGRYDLACEPVRDLLISYLRERQPGLDYTSLYGLAITLGRSFWKNLEDHHPGISSLKLPPDVAAGWKKRVQQMKSGSSILMTVRAFYLDLSQWALDEPARWGP